MMYPFIFFFCALGFHICLYGIFISMTSNRIDIVSFGPKLPTPKLLFHFWVKFENLFGRDALDSLDNLAWAHRWNTLYQKMNMVFIRSNFNELNLIVNSWQADPCSCDIDPLAKRLPVVTAKTAS